MKKTLIALLFITCFYCTSEEIFIRSGGNCKQDGAYVYSTENINHNHTGGSISASQLGAIWAKNNLNLVKAKTISYQLDTVTDDGVLSLEEPAELSGLSADEVKTWYTGLNKAIDGATPNECTTVQESEQNKPVKVECKHSHRFNMTPQMFKNLELNRGVGALATVGKKTTVTVSVKNGIENAPSGSKKYGNMYIEVTDKKVVEHQHDIVVNCLGEDLEETDDATDSTTTTASTGACQMNEFACVMPSTRDATQYCADALSTGFTSAAYVSACSIDGCVATCKTTDAVTYLYNTLYDSSSAATYCTGTGGNLDETCTGL